MSSLESAYEARLEIPRLNITILMETWKGGDKDSEESKKRSAATRKQTARGGMGMRSNLTLSRECDAEAWALKETLESLAGNEPVRAIRQFLSAPQNGVPVGKPEVVTGILKNPKYPDYDLEGNDTGMLEVEISADE